MGHKKPRSWPSLCDRSGLCTIRTPKKPVIKNLRTATAALSRPFVDALVTRIDVFFVTGDSKSSPKKSPSKPKAAIEKPANWDECKVKKIDIADSNVKFKLDKLEQPIAMTYLVEKAPRGEDKDSKSSRYGL